MKHEINKTLNTIAVFASGDVKKFKNREVIASIQYRMEVFNFYSINWESVKNNNGLIRFNKSLHFYFISSNPNCEEFFDEPLYRHHLKNKNYIS